ncbi:hypothetical protein D1BOALGB6SA_3236 [Olavius sp. associated proteobacterium Delta 1]|nr:hypothetical protein D1BOALGB6SA_3236 [Olavius sp. associated proteobacterium Delta 1]
MFRKLIFIIYIVGLLAPLRMGWCEDYSFRNSKWGLTKEAVTASEIKMDPVEINENTIKYKTQILENNVELIYLFSQNKLAGAVYKLNDNYLNSHHFLNTYKKFKAALTQKYGQPREEMTNWLNDTFRNVSQKRGLALSLGHTEYFANWETAISNISIRLKEENYSVLCVIEYWSKEYPYLSEENKVEHINKEDIIDPF